MRLLIVGGSAFVGRAIVHDAVDRGHDVTVLNRGRTPSDLPDSVERLVGDRQGDLTALDGRAFDATVDVIAYRASDVDHLADSLGSRGGHHLQISSISAYRDPVDPGATEDEAALWPLGVVNPEAPIDMNTYGPLEAEAEDAARLRFGDETAIVRPTFVIGAHDLTMRFPYWVARLIRGGDVAVPGSRATTLQYIDARDLAHFCVGVLEQQLSGAFHTCGPFPQEGFFASIERVAAQVAPAGTRLVEVDAEALAAEGAGGRHGIDFPLWSGPEADGALDMNPQKALSAGLKLRPIEESAEQVRSWWGDREWPEQWLSADEERELLGRLGQ